MSAEYVENAAGDRLWCQYHDETFPIDGHCPFWHPEEAPGCTCDFPAAGHALRCPLYDAPSPEEAKPMSDEEARVELTDAEWREFQSIPDQGYSHRHWVNRKIAERMQASREAALSRELETWKRRCAEETIAWTEATKRADAAERSLREVTEPHDAWDEGFEAGATWPQHTASGVPIDPPTNPYTRTASEASREVTAAEVAAAHNAFWAHPDQTGGLAAIRAALVAVREVRS